MLPPLQFMPLGWRMQAERTVVAGVGSVSHVDAHSCSGLAVQVFHCLRPGVACGHAQPWYLCYSSSTCCNTYTLTRTHACMHTNIYIYNKRNIAAVLLFATCKGKCQMKPHPADKRMARRSNALCIPSPSIIHFEMAQSHRCARANRRGKSQPSGRQTLVNGVLF